MDNESSPASIYNSTLNMGATSLSLKDSSGVTSWPNNGSGAYTFTVTLPASSAYTDENSTCTSAYLVTQTNS